jgi:hypothetical protein
MVVDYKTGKAETSAWELPRPEDVQLPLYACYGLDSGKEVGGLVFARVQTGDGKQAFAGCVKDAKATLLKNLRGNTNLVKKPLTGDQLRDWRERIEQLAAEFVAGHADVDPRDYPDTCTNCGLQLLCRVEEQMTLAGAADEWEPEEADNG